MSKTEEYDWRKDLDALVNPDPNYTGYYREVQDRLRTYISALEFACDAYESLLILLPTDEEAADG